MKLKRVISIVTAMVMLTLSACGNTQSSAPEPSAETQVETQEGEVAQVDEEMEEVTLDVFMTSPGENPFTSGVQTDAVASYIKEQTGVTLNLIPTDDGKQDAMAASGDLYDLSLMRMEHVTPLIASGAIASLDDYLYLAPEFTERFSGMVNYSRQFLSNDEDNFYAILMRSKTEPAPMANARYGTFVSWNAYQEIGAPEIKNADDLLDVMAQIQANNPTTEDGRNTYAFSSFTDWGVNWMLSNFILNKNNAQYALGSGLQSFNIEDFSYLDLYNQEHPFWRAADLYFKANQLGILDPEAFTQKWEDYSQKIASGQVLSASAEWDADPASSRLEDEGIEDKYMDVQWADTPEVPTWVSRASEFGMTGRLFLVSSKCDEAKLKGIARLLEFVFSEDGARSIMLGPKGDTWDYDDNGVAVFTEECKAQMAENPNYLIEKGAYRYYTFIGQDYDALATTPGNEGKFIDLHLNPEYIMQELTETDKKYCEFYDVDIPLEAATKRENQSTIYEGSINLLPAENPTSINRLSTQVEDYIQQAIPAMVMSGSKEEYDAKYAEIQEELKSIGYDELTAYYEQAWAEAIATYHELMAK